MNEMARVQPTASPGQLALRRLQRNRAAMAGAVVLLTFHLLAVFAGFFSPYSPTDQEFRNHFFHPPTPLHFRDASGAFHLRPFITATYLADNREIRYAEGIPASLCYRRPPANLNPYLSDSLESQDPIVTVRNDRGQPLATLTSLQETGDDSGIFCAALALDANLLTGAPSIQVDTAFGDHAVFSVTDSDVPENAEAARGVLYLQNRQGKPAAQYSRLVERRPVRFLVHGWRYRILWFFQSDLHLFGTDEPAHAFLLGTDQSGRDQLSRILFGAQISLTVGLLAVLLTTILGLLVGGVAGYYGGAVDSLLMRFAEVLLSIPSLYLILALGNIIPDRLQESYDRVRQLGIETFAWQQNPRSFVEVMIIIILLLSYYCYKGKWSRGRLAVSAAVAGIAWFGPRLLLGVLGMFEWALPGETHITSEWTFLLVILILSAVGWAGMARVIRGMVLPLREAEFVMSARALGARDSRVILRHVLPNTFGYVIVRATMVVPLYILAEVSLSFLGLGVQEPVPSWGNMLTQAQNMRVLTQFTWTLAPGFLIFLTVLAYNILGDGLRDAFDPRQK